MWAAYARRVPERKCDCGCPNTFSPGEAEKDLERYRRKGPDKTTRALIDAIRAEGVEGATLLDVGGGIGAIQLELLDAGVASASSVDASAGYIEVATREAARRGFGDRTVAHVGAFEDVAAGVETADIVTLDRVICCDPDLRGLLAATTSHARRLIGLVYPRDTWWNRLLARVLNAFCRLTRDSTRWYQHSPSEVDAILRQAGFIGRDVVRDLIWHVVVYRRASPNPV